MATTSTNLVLYESPVSSYVQKVKIALREKGIPFTKKVPEDLMSDVKSGPLRSANPRLEVPVLIDGDLQIFDSTIILEYIEDKFPDKPLRSKDPAARARARMIEEICDNEYEATNWGICEVRWFGRAEGALAQELERQGKHHIETIQAWLAEKLGSGPWFDGEEFGWTDLCVGPLVNRSAYLGLGPAPGTPLADWLVRLKERPAVAETFMELEKGIPGVQKLAPLVKSGEKRRQYRNARLEWMLKAGGLDVVTEGMRKNNVRFNWPDNI